MGLLKKINFSLYRDADFEAFYDVDEKYRRRIIIGHMMIHLLPLLIFVMVYWYNPENRYTIYLVIASLLFYVIAVGEAAAYLYPASRKTYKKYLLWIILPVIVVAAGYIGFSFGEQFTDISIEPGENVFVGLVWLIIGPIGVIALFMWTHIGLANILQASNELYTRKAEVETDIRFATEVQERFLRDIEISNSSVQAYAKSIAANEMGGDFFELQENEESVFASVGDVSGHSFGAGLLMTMTKSSLQTHLDYNHNPALMMKALNKMFLKQSDRSMYATMVMTKLSLSTKKAILCNAGHLPVLHYQAETGALTQRHKKGLGLGLVEDAEYNHLEFSLHKGDILFLYSDGLIETRNEEMDIRELDFFESAIKQVLDESKEVPKVLANKIIEKVRDADHAEYFEDDASLIVIKV